MTKRMYRSRTEKVIAGICGGLGLYLNIDPTIVRLVFVALIFVTGGLMIPAYLLTWIIMPRERLLTPEEVSEHDATMQKALEASEALRAEKKRAKAEEQARPKSTFVRILPGILLVVFGLIAFLNYQYWWDWSDLLPVGLILLGLYFILRQWDNGKNAENSHANPGDPATAGALGGSGFSSSSQSSSHGGDE